VLNIWESMKGSSPPAQSTGLYHFAILLPDRVELAIILRRILEHNWLIEEATDDGISEAINLKDSDNNGIEIYYDRPRDQRPHDSKGEIAMYTRLFNLASFWAEADNQ
jgi:catechol 2,3-dioxygenase